MDNLKGVLGKMNEHSSYCADEVQFFCVHICCFCGFRHLHELGLLLHKGNTFTGPKTDIYI